MPSPSSSHFNDGSRAAAGWLHLSDVRFGAPEQADWWSRQREPFLRDLEGLISRNGPLDLILISGSLTNQGLAEEFEQLGTWVEELRGAIGSFGRPPAVVVLPGPRDLTQKALPPLFARLFRHYFNDRELRNDLFANPAQSNQYRAALAEAYTPFQRFCERLASLRTEKFRPVGLLPGDTIFSEPGRLGVVALNTSFTALCASNPDEAERNGDIDRTQLNALCGQDPSQWAQNHQLTILLTYHAPELLHASAQQRFALDINPQQRFALHYCSRSPGSDTPSSAAQAALQRKGQLSSLPLYSPALASVMAGQAPRIGYQCGWLRAHGAGSVVHAYPRVFRMVHRVQVTPDYDSAVELERDGYFAIELAAPSRGSGWGAAHDPYGDRSGTRNTASARGTDPPRNDRSGEPGTRRPRYSRSSLRGLLMEILRLDSDLSAFCLDYFPTVYREFTGGMDRTTKLNLLLLREDDTEIVRRLSESAPERFARYRNLLEELG